MAKWKQFRKAALAEGSKNEKRMANGIKTCPMRRMMEAERPVPGEGRLQESAQPDAALNEALLAIERANQPKFDAPC